MRAIHVSGSTPMLPGMRWVAIELSPALRDFKHLIKDSLELATRLRDVKFVWLDIKLFKFDVREFYMSGLHKDPVARTSKMSEAKCRRSSWRCSSVSLAASTSPSKARTTCGRARRGLERELSAAGK